MRLLSKLWQQKIIPRHCRMSLEGENLPLLETSELESERFRACSGPQDIQRKVGESSNTCRFFHFSSEPTAPSPVVSQQLRVFSLTQ